VSPSQPSALEALDAFYLEHRLCYQLDGGQEAAPQRVWLACTACEVPIEVRLATAPVPATVDPPRPPRYRRRT
jgi:hypothetical protein